MKLLLPVTQNDYLISILDKISFTVVIDNLEGEVVPLLVDSNHLSSSAAIVLECHLMTPSPSPGTLGLAVSGRCG
jgi:hypothetical protein